MFSKQGIPDAVKSDGTIAKYEVGKGYTLTAGTWYIDASVPDASAVSIHVQWDAVIVATSIKYHSSNAPAYKSISQPYTDSAAAVDVDNKAAPVTGGWIPKTLATAPDVQGAGASSTTAAIAVLGGAAGGGMIDLATNGARRGRIEWVLTTGGVARQFVHGKQA
jgi:hypothetical protein